MSIRRTSLISAAAVFHLDEHFWALLPTAALQIYSSNHTGQSSTATYWLWEKKQFNPRLACSTADKFKVCSVTLKYFLKQLSWTRVKKSQNQQIIAASAGQQPKMKAIRPQRDGKDDNSPSPTKQEGTNEPEGHRRRCEIIKKNWEQPPNKCKVK